MIQACVGSDEKTPALVGVLKLQNCSFGAVPPISSQVQAVRTQHAKAAAHDEFTVKAGQRIATATGSPLRLAEEPCRPHMFAPAKIYAVAAVLSNGF